MSRLILVPLDGSEFSESALTVALSIAPRPPFTTLPGSYPSMTSVALRSSASRVKSSA
jgi:hypothetical protein